ncbi:MAG: PQQ-dependent sugar dehydrogenase [Rhodospirillales bacterium]|nr:PQQ-dependent sugar dehydrogenase [Rhodospirillales bacterium]
MIRLVLYILAFMALFPFAGAAQQNQLDLIRMPDGFKIFPFAQVPGARSMAVVPELGVVFVGTRSDSIYAVIDANADGIPERVEKVKGGLKVANGIDWRQGWLYVAEQHRVVRFRAPDLKTLKGAPAEILYDGLPDDRRHGWRYARFGPDGRVYISIGSPCNICTPKGLEGTIVRMAPTGGRPEIYASGIRNSVGFDFQPDTGELYFTDNGADNMGDDSPPDEFNHAPRPGLWFGFPYFGGGADRTPDFKADPLPRTVTFPVINFNAHVASLGVSFYRGTMFPPEYRGDAFVAEHGSWNRTLPDGYRVMRIRFDKKSKKVVKKEIFADGWLQRGQSWGRPVDVKELADGSLLVSGDREGAIYRITYKKP